MDYITAIPCPSPCATIPSGAAVTKITDAYRSNARRPFIICDFSPPRGASLDFLDAARRLDADFISVNYNPGRVPRADSAITAHLIRRNTGREVLFTLAVRDMNPLALQSHLLGAAALGLENLLVLGGDPFPTPNRSKTRAIGAMRPTELMRVVQGMNEGVDRRGRPLDGATDLCVGGVINLSADFESEARLTFSKVQAGARFFLTQPVFEPRSKSAFERTYRSIAGAPLPTPIFYGLQILRPTGVSFSPIPPRYMQQLKGGRSGEEIALEVWEALAAEGVDSLYLVPPIGPRGVRDYDATSRFLRQLRA